MKNSINLRLVPSEIAMSSMFVKFALLTLLVSSLSAVFAGPQPLTQTQLSYQPDGDLAGQTLSWADGQSHPDQLNNVSQTAKQVLLAGSVATSDPCTTKLSLLPATLQQDKAYLRCVEQTRISQPANLTTLRYTDTRIGKVVAQIDPMDHVTTYQYDQLGRKTAVTQAGKTIHISYASPGQVGNTSGYNKVTVSDPDGFARRTLVDGLGQAVAKQVDTCPDGPSTVAGCSSPASYGALMPNGQFRTLAAYSYVDSQGVIQQKVQSSTDVSGAAKIDYQYDALGRLVAKLTSEQGQLKGALTPVTQGTFYDNRDRLQVSYQQVSGPTELSSTPAVNPDAVQVTYFNSSNKVSQTRLISLADLQAVLGGNVPVNELFVPANQAKLASTLVAIKAHNKPIGWVTTTEYNGLLQKQQESNGLQQVDYDYNDRGLLTQTYLTSAPKNSRLAGDATQPPYQRQTTYNLLGQLRQISLTQPIPAAGVGPTNSSHNGPVHQYNGAGELTRLAQTGLINQQPQTWTTQLAYNGDGKLIAQANDYATITYCHRYNTQGQLVASWALPDTTELSACQSAAIPASATQWRYYQTASQQPVGKPASISANGQTINYHYYLDGKLQRISYSGVDQYSISYSYNVLGQVITRTVHHAEATDLITNYSYGTGTAHQLLQVSSGAMQVSYHYNDRGNVTQIQRSVPDKAVTTIKTYDGYGRLAASQLYQGSGTQPVQTQSYSYQQEQLTGVVESNSQVGPTDKTYNEFNHLVSYQYDEDNRLQKVTTKTLAGSTLKQVSYSFDANNNITEVNTGYTDAEGEPGSQQPLTHHYNGFDQLTDNGVSYSPAGNLIKDGQGNGYHYNDLNQLTGYTGAHGSYSYLYYPNGELQSESQGDDRLTLYYGANGQVASIKDSQGHWVNYVAGLQLTGEIYQAVHANTLQYVLYACQGKTPSGWLASQGDSWQQRDPYGFSEAVFTPKAETQPSPAQGGLLTLAAHPHLIGFNGNYQDPASGNVFMGARVYDPGQQRFLQWDSADMLNHYAYGQDNPIANYDPSGHMSLKKLLGIVGGFVTAVGVLLTLVAGVGEGLDALGAVMETADITDVELPECAAYDEIKTDFPDALAKAKAKAAKAAKEFVRGKVLENFAAINEQINNSTTFKDVEFFYGMYKGQMNELLEKPEMNGFGNDLSNFMKVAEDGILQEKNVDMSAIRDAELKFTAKPGEYNADPEYREMRPGSKGEKLMFRIYATKFKAFFSNYNVYSSFSTCPLSETYIDIGPFFSNTTLLG
jgi:RHS repeat-associated protein